MSRSHSVKEIDRLLHLLRNPCGHSGDEIRNARLAAADLIEELVKESGEVREPSAWLYEIPPYADHKTAHGVVLDQGGVGVLPDYVKAKFTPLYVGFHTKKS